MNLKIVKNRYLNAFFLLLLFSAIIHVGILTFLSVKNQDPSFLNYFNILNIDYFLPNFPNSLWGNITSSAVIAALYVIILNGSKKE